MKRIYSILAVLLVLCLASCSSSKNISASTAAASPQAFASDDAVREYSAENGSGEAQAVKSAAGGNVTVDGISNRKIIQEAHVNMEALDFEQSVKSTLEYLEQSGGYIASESLNGGAESNYRSATYVLKIPQKNYSSFLKQIANAGNIVSQSQGSQDITSEYVDVEARLKSLRMQEERLLDMMSKAGELETLLAIQNQLTEVTYNIESYTIRKTTYDNMTEYSTVNVEITQVQRITEVKDTFWQRLKAAFADSWSDFSDGCQDLAVSAVHALPAILALGLIILVCVLAFGKKIKKQINKPVEKAELKSNEK